MRLGQLSRKLNISTTEIGAIIADEFEITLGDHPNIKIDDEHSKFIIEKFQKTESENSDTNPKIEKLSTKENISVKNSETNAYTAKENDTSTDLEQEEIETIRVKAAKLEGLTVVNKIDLPPPPPPEMVEIDGVMYDKAELKKQRISERKERDAQKRKEAAKRAADRKLRFKKTSKKNKKELSFAEKRSLEENRDRDRKKQEERRKRYRQKKHYESKHKIHKPTDLKPDKVSEVEIKVEETFIETRPEPKTMLGKIWRWLNTY